MRLPLRLRIARELLRLWLLYRWRRGELGLRLPVMAEPDRRGELPPIDTGGAYRPTFRSQFGDSSESHTSPHSEGSNCTMSSAAMALQYHGGPTRKGGDMRHAQGDQEGGTDLYDAAEAFARNGESLSIRSGQGWAAVVDALEAGRGVILQGTGGLTGCGDYTGGHAVYVNPERSGSRWLKGDPECSGFEWTEESSLKGFATRLSSSVYFAVTAARSSNATPEPTPPPTPEPEPCPECPPPETHTPAELEELARRSAAAAVTVAGDRLLEEWVDWMGEPRSAREDRWDVGGWGDGGELELALEDEEPDPCLEPVPGARWARGLPFPVGDALVASRTPGRWDATGWRRSTWAGA